MHTTCIHQLCLYIPAMNNTKRKFYSNSSIYKSIQKNNILRNKVNQRGEWLTHWNYKTSMKEFKEDYINRKLKKKKKVYGLKDNFFGWGGWFWDHHCVLCTDSQSSLHHWAPGVHSVDMIFSGCFCFLSHFAFLWPFQINSKPCERQYF